MKNNTDTGFTLKKKQMFKILYTNICVYFIITSIGASAIPTNSLLLFTNGAPAYEDQLTIMNNK